MLNQTNANFRPNSMCISMLCTGNNTIRTAWDPVTRKTIKTVSAGRIGSKSSGKVKGATLARRGTAYAAEMVGRELGLSLLKILPLPVRNHSRRDQSVTILFAGQSAAIGSGLRGLRSTGLRISSMVDVTPLPHNGCRARKARRV